MRCHAKGTDLELAGLQSVDIAEEEHFQEKTARCSQAFCILSPFCAGEGAATHTEVLSAGPRFGACSQLHRMSALQVCGMSLLNSPEQLSLFFPGEGVGVGLMDVWHCCSCSQVGKLRHGGYGNEAAFPGGGWVVFCWVSAVAVLPNAFPCTKQFIALLSWPLVLCLWG